MLGVFRVRASHDGGAMADWASFELRRHSEVRALVARSAKDFRVRSTSVSVVVAAHTMDRWDDVVAGMDALAHQTVPPLETILVVDHNDRLLGRARDRFPDVRVLDNLRTGGASGARNTGIAEAKGSVIAFVDDDARPEPDWIEQLLAAYDDEYVMAVGGVAVPVWPGRRPDHLPPELDWIVGCTYQGQPTVRTDVRNLWGCNMSVRREAFDLVGTFDEQVGRIGLIPLGAEETELCIRIRQRIPGARVVFEPAAVVHHRVTEARCQWSYLVSRSHAEGISKAAMSRLVGTTAGTSDERTYATRVLPRAVLRELGRLNLRGAAGTTWWYVRGRLGHVSGLGREGSSARTGSRA
jgi:glucosyl-dolichyl phosphate glucuronosyltransferase